jgi:hypothetical protein
MRWLLESAEYKLANRCSHSDLSNPVATPYWRASAALRTAIENWAEQQKDKPSRSEAIRRLIEFALAVKTKSKKTPATKNGRSKIV